MFRQPIPRWLRIAVTMGIERRQFRIPQWLLVEVVFIGVVLLKLLLLLAVLGQLLPFLAGNSRLRCVSAIRCRRGIL